METTTAKDGTMLAYEKLGSGPPVVLVDGAFCRREFGPMAGLAKRLSSRFTVLHYDRRGRGSSTDTPPYSVDREVEDLRAICEIAGAAPCVYGISSGAALVIRALAGGLAAKKAVLYEPPLMLDGTHIPEPFDFRERIGAMLAEGRRDDAVKLFMRVVGVPAFGIWFMRILPNVWPKLRGVVHTLPYDFAALGETQRGGALPAEFAEKLGSISTPSLVLVGGKSPRWMHYACERVAAGIGGATLRVLAGQDHNVAANAVAPRLVEFFG